MNIEEIFNVFGIECNSENATFPLRDNDGNIFSNFNYSFKDKVFIYPDGIEIPLFGFYELKKMWNDINDYYEEWDNNVASYDEVIVTDNIHDAIKHWKNGESAVAFTDPDSELQQKQIEELKDICAEVFFEKGE